MTFLISELDLRLSINGHHEILDLIPNIAFMQILVFPSKSRILETNIDLTPIFWTRYPYGQALTFRKIWLRK